LYQQEEQIKCIPIRISDHLDILQQKHSIDLTIWFIPFR